MLIESTMTTSRGQINSCAFVRSLLILSFTSYLGSRAATLIIPDSAGAAHTKTVLTYYMGKRTWHQARAVCESLDNGHLLGVVDGDMYDVIHDLSEGSWTAVWDHCWTGLHWESSTDLVWADNTCTPSTLPIEYFKDSGQADYELGKACYQFDKGSVGLEKKPCSDIYNFICQQSLAVSPSVYHPHPFSMMTATPTSDCEALCTGTTGCFLYHAASSGDLCYLSVVNSGATSYVKDVTAFEAKRELNIPSVPGPVPIGDVPAQCSPFEVQLSITLADSTDLDTPAIGITCPVITEAPTVTTTTATTTPMPPATTEAPTTAAETTAITTAPPPPPPTTTAPTTEAPTTVSSSTSTTTTTTNPALTTDTTTITTQSTTTTTTATTSPPTSSTSSTTTASPSPITIPPHPPIPVSNETLAREMEALIKDLIVDTRSTSKFKARLTSAYDPRKSSQYVGLTGILVIAFLALAVLMLDVPTIVTTIKLIHWTQPPKPEVAPDDPDTPTKGEGRGGGGGGGGDWDRSWGESRKKSSA